MRDARAVLDYSFARKQETKRGVKREHSKCENRGEKSKSKERSFPDGYEIQSLTYNGYVSC